MRPFLPHELLAKMDGHKNGMPNMSPSSSPCLEMYILILVKIELLLIVNSGKMFKHRLIKRANTIAYILDLC